MLGDGDSCRWAEPLKQPEEGKRACRAEEGRWGGSSAVRYQCLFMYLFLCFQAGLPCRPWGPAVSAEPWGGPRALCGRERPGPGPCADGPAAVFTLALCSGSFALCPQRGSCLVQPWQPTGLATVGGQAQPDPALAPCLPGASRFSVWAPPAASPPPQPQLPRAHPLVCSVLFYSITGKLSSFSWYWALNLSFCTELHPQFFFIFRLQTGPKFPRVG